MAASDAASFAMAASYKDKDFKNTVIDSNLLIYDIYKCTESNFSVGLAGYCTPSHTNYASSTKPEITSLSYSLQV